MAVPHKVIPGSSVYQESHEVTMAGNKARNKLIIVKNHMKYRETCKKSVMKDSIDGIPFCLCIPLLTRSADSPKLTVLET